MVGILQVAFGFIRIQIRRLSRRRWHERAPGQGRRQLLQLVDPGSGQTLGRGPGGAMGSPPKPFAGMLGRRLEIHEAKSGHVVCLCNFPGVGQEGTNCPPLHAGVGPI